MRAQILLMLSMMSSFAGEIDDNPTSFRFPWQRGTQPYAEIHWDSPTRFYATTTLPGQWGGVGVLAQWEYMDSLYRQLSGGLRLHYVLPWRIEASVAAMWSHTLVSGQAATNRQDGEGGILWRASPWTRLGLGFLWQDHCIRPQYAIEWKLASFYRLELLLQHRTSILPQARIGQSVAITRRLALLLGWSSTEGSIAAGLVWNVSTLSLSFLQQHQVGFGPEQHFHATWERRP